MNSHPILALCFLAATASLAVDEPFIDEAVPTAMKGEVKDGKVEVRVVRRISWTQGPCYPVKVSLIDAKGVPAVTRQLTEGATVELAGFIAPGKYKIRSEVDDAWGYWSSYGGTITVAADGKISIQSQAVVHRVKMTLLAPAQMEVVKEKRPTLKWKAVAGAKSYTIRWFEEDPETRKVLSEKQGVNVTGPEWTFDADVIPARTYEWQVDANDENGSLIAYFASGYFSTK